MRRGGVLCGYVEERGEEERRGERLVQSMYKSESMGEKQKRVRLS